MTFFCQTNNTPSSEFIQKWWGWGGGGEGGGPKFVYPEMAFPDNQAGYSAYGKKKQIRPNPSRDRYFGLWYRINPFWQYHVFEKFFFSLLSARFIQRLLNDYSIEFKKL